LPPATLWGRSSTSSPFPLHSAIPLSRRVLSVETVWTLPSSAPSPESPSVALAPGSGHGKAPIRKAAMTCQTPEKPVPDTQVLLSSCSPCRVTAYRKSNYLATCPQVQRTRNPLKIIDFLLEISVRQKKGGREEGAFCSYLEGGMLQTAPPTRLAWQKSPSLAKPELNRCPPLAVTSCIK